MFLSVSALALLKFRTSLRPFMALIQVIWWTRLMYTSRTMKSLKLEKLDVKLCISLAILQTILDTSSANRYSRETLFSWHVGLAGVVDVAFDFCSLM